MAEEPGSGDNMTTRTQFTLYPAIDVLKGKCVRLFKGDYNASTTYSDAPAEVAKRWLGEGANWLHVVDLDGAKAGRSINESVISDVVAAANEAGAKVQVGGGIRSYEAIDRWLSLGVSRVIIGTAAMDSKWMEGAVSRFGQNSIVAGLDGRNGKLAVQGWTEQTNITLEEIGASLFEIGVHYALVTDVERDGTLSGANLELSKRVQKVSGLSVIASGGIRHVEDVLAASDAGLAGAIAGRSLYDGTLHLWDTLSRLKEAGAC
jgi:phosphoribosylformimino-5-aminoimidazole carboxamide ribotide isomerase